VSSVEAMLVVELCVLATSHLSGRSWWKRKPKAFLLVLLVVGILTVLITFERYCRTCSTETWSTLELYPGARARDELEEQTYTGNVWRAHPSTFRLRMMGLPAIYRELPRAFPSLVLPTVTIIATFTFTRKSEHCISPTGQTVTPCGRVGDTIHTIRDAMPCITFR
jgi:hypothetical protein